MLSLVDHPGDSGSRCSRRAFLTAGSLALGGLSLPELIRARQSTLRAGLPTHDLSVVFLFMHGGPPQAETFDPKMTAPSEYRSAVGEIPTSLPGVTFGTPMQKLARLADKLTVVRSFQMGNGGAHNIEPIVGRDTQDANLGSIYSRIVGSVHPTTGLPSNVALFPRAVDPDAQPPITQFGRFDASGSFGRQHAPFIPGVAGSALENLKLHVPLNRLDDRERLLGKLDSLKRHLDSTGAIDGLDTLRQQAYDVLLNDASRAFDLSGEDPGTVARYDTSHLVPPVTIDKRWNNRKWYLDHGQTLGKLMLMARRLCERGVGFVTVTTGFVWDMHADQNNAHMQEGMRYCALPFDHAVAAFIRDVEARGLSDRILLIACGEMGRTPKINSRGGRDHWGGLAPLLVYGGGLNMGQVVGQSDSRAAYPASEPIRINNLVSTILHALFDVSELRLRQGLPPEILALIDAVPPIRELF
jgi:hypothetical protein